MKKKIHIVLNILFCLLFAASLYLPAGCANTSAAPSGGSKDSIPPILLETFPEVNATRVDTSIKRVELIFNEYVKLVDPNKNIILSPPQEKAPAIRTKGKGIVVDFKYPLKPNTSYSLYFGAAIQDNNEGNLFPAFALGFSTGETVDSLMYSGVVVNASTLLPIDNATVLLHLNPSDTSLTRCLPVAATRTDKYGYFVLRNLKDTSYTLYALEDQNNNYRYEQTGGELIGFLKQTVRPTKVMFPYAPEIQPYFQNDTAGLLRRPIETGVYLFKERSTRQAIRNYERVRPRGLAIKFGAADPEILSVILPGIDSTEIIRQHNYYRDSIIYWITTAKIPDTLAMYLTYKATDDTLNKLISRTDTLKFIPYTDPEEVKKEQDAASDAPPGGGRGKAERGIKAPPSMKPDRKVLSYTSKVMPEVIQQEGILLTFKDLLIEEDFSALRLWHKSPKGDTVPDSFTYSRDSLDFCLYRIIPGGKNLEGTDYELHIPKDVFKDVNGYPNDSLIVKYTTLKSDDFGAFIFTLNNVPSPLIVELMNDTRSQVLRTLHVKSDTIVTFPYIKAGKYSLLITEDLNGNGIWDTGSLSRNLQAERVRVFKLPGGNTAIDLKEKMELTQTIDIAQLLNENVTLTIPDKSKK